MALLGNAGLLKALTPVSYGALTTDYENRVIAAGGPALTTAEKRAVDTFFYGSYSDGASGTGNVASFASLFTPGFLWAPVSDFGRINIPLIGSAMSISGFSSSDWSKNTGLLGGASKFLDSGVLGSSLGQNNVHLMHIVDALPSTALATIGARVSTTATFLDLGANSSTTIRGRINRSTSTSSTRLSDASSTFCLGRRNNSANFDLWSVTGGTLSSATTTIASVSPPAFSIYIGAVNTGGSAALFFTNRMSVASAGAAPADAQINILANAAAAFHSTRATL